MAAKLVIDQRVILGDGTLIQIRVWRVPEPVSPSPHKLKYSLFFGRPGERIVGYDNERGKGDHRHIGAREMPYAFVSIEQLLADFRADVEAIRGIPL